MTTSEPAGARTVLVTGATDGLGAALAERLVTEGHTVLVHGRSPERLERTAERLRGLTSPDRVRTLLADLADLDQVRGLASQVRETTERLDVLVSNAGIGSGKPDLRTRQESADGFELRFAVNYLAGFLLTLELLPLLCTSVPARVVWVASLGQAPIDFDDPQITRGYDGQRAYGQSKLAQITAGFELAERLAGSGVTVTTLHPSTYMPTKMVLEERGESMDELEQGVAATHRLAVGDDVAGVTGRYFDRQREARAHDQAYDAAARRQLWDLSLRLTGAPDVALG